MKRFYLLALTITVIAGQAPPVAAANDPSPRPLIAAIQTGKPGASGDDFVEVYNPATESVDVTGWKLQYRSAATKGTAGWTTKRTVGCVAALADSSCTVSISPHGSLMFATYDLPDIAEQPLTSGLSDTGGQLRLVDSQDIVLDMLGYGTAAEAERAQPAPAPPLGLSLLRKSNDGRIVDTDNNAQDFMVGCYMPVPQGEILPSGPPATQPCPVNEDEDPPEQAGEVLSGTTETPNNGQPLSYPQLFITELFPDPASPQVDSTDEFIELYNPGSEPVDASGYMLESGTDFRYHFTLADTIVPAGGYVAVMAADSHLSLTNSGTAVRLVNPAGETIDTVANYGPAKSGQSWALDNGAWQWTTTPTAGQANTFTMPAAAPTKKTTAKTASAKTTKASGTTAKTAKTAASTTPLRPADDQAVSTGFNYWLFAPVVALAAGYIGYEYRHDIGRLWHKLKQTISGKKDTEPTPQTD